LLCGIHDLLNGEVLTLSHRSPAPSAYPPYTA
jgi:hypothetical protein